MKRIIGYLGSKINLFDFLRENMINKFNVNEDKIFIDLFSGTGSVSKLINNETSWNIISNDLSLYSRILNIQIQLYKITKNEIDKLKETLIYLDNLDLIEGDFYNEFSMGGTPKTINDNNVFCIRKKTQDGKLYFENNQEYKNSRMFFKGIVGKKIDTIKLELKKLFDHNEITENYKDLLLLFLMNYMNKNSNYTGVYGAYLKHDKFKKRKVVPFLDESLFEYIIKNYSLSQKKENIRSSKLADKCIDEFKLKNINKKDVIVYMDPPYSTRSYESNYHILDYLCDFEFNIKQIKFNSKTATKNKKIENPFNSKNKTLNYFENLIINSLKISDDIFISYSSDGLLKQKDIDFIVEKHSLKLNTFTQKYKRYTSGENKGQNTGKNNKVFEILWHIKN